MSTTPFGPSDPTPASDTQTLEFGCGDCGRMLKVPATAVGRQARCPQCGTVQAVPPSGSPPPAACRARRQRSAGPRLPGCGPSATVPAGAATDRVCRAALRTAARQAAPGIAVLAETASRQRPRQPRGTRNTDQAAVRPHLLDEIAKIYVGQDELVLGTLVALFSSGHVLIESVPGLGKTLFVRTLGRVLGCQFGRIQFTADLMPSDITGAPIFDMKTQEFRFRPGPVFTQLLLADEINRSPAKTHAALLEIMQEYRVTIDGTSHTLERPFLVLATQNPIESEGTYNLPEAQLDRFMFKLVADYPPEAEEAQHPRRCTAARSTSTSGWRTNCRPVTSPEEILRITRQNGEVHVDDQAARLHQHDGPADAAVAAVPHGRVAAGRASR